MSKLKRLNESGLVSIIVTMILIIVMTLVVLGMSRNATREQRQALDRQLSDQAYYNAESGIGDWGRYLYENPTARNTKTTCDTTGLNTTDFPGTIPVPNIDTNNSYTCVLYDKAPLSIEIGDLAVDDSKTYPIRSTSDISTIRFVWRNPSGLVISDCTQTANSVRPTALLPNCVVGGLRIDLVNPAGAGRGRDELRNQNFIGTLLPGNSQTNINRADGIGNGQGVVGVGSCNPTECTAEIRAVGLPVGSTFYLNIRSIYAPNTITVTALNGAGTAVPLIGAQYVIDVTGKSVDVLRRVRVRLPAVPQIDKVDYALRTADAICKLLVVNRDASPPTATLSTSPAQCDPN